MGDFSIHDAYNSMLGGHAYWAPLNVYMLNRKPVCEIVYAAYWMLRK